MATIILSLFAVLCFVGAIFFFNYAASNFYGGLTLESMALSVILAVVGISFVAAAFKNAQRRGRRR